MIKVIEANNKKLMKVFATFPVRLYKGNKYFVPSIVEDEIVIQDGSKNLAKGSSDCKCFLAYKENKVVGRICAIINHDSNKKFNEKCLRFNRIDFIDDINVVKALFNEVIRYAKENNLEYIHGPWGFNDTDREGMLTEGFDEVSNYATNYSYPYYIHLMEELGFKKESEWIEYRFDVDNIDPRFFDTAKSLKEKGYRDLCDTMPLKRIIKEYGEKFFICYNNAYKDLDNFIPIEGEMIKSTLKQFATIINKNYFSVIINSNDDVVAFGVGLPYIGHALRRAKGRMLLAAIPLLLTIAHPRAVELALIGVDPAYRNMGLHSLIVTRFSKNLHKHHIKDVYMDPILTTNLKMLHTWKGTGKEIRAKRQTYKISVAELEKCCRG